MKQIKIGHISQLNRPEPNRRTWSWFCFEVGAVDSNRTKLNTPKVWGNYSWHASLYSNHALQNYLNDLNVSERPSQRCSPPEGSHQSRTGSGTESCFQFPRLASFYLAVSNRKRVFFLFLSVISLVSLQPPAASVPDQTPPSELLNTAPLNRTTSLHLSWTLGASGLLRAPRSVVEQKDFILLPLFLLWSLHSFLDLYPSLNAPFLWLHFVKCPTCCRLSAGSETFPHQKPVWAKINPLHCDMKYFL